MSITIYPFKKPINIVPPADGDRCFKQWFKTPSGEVEITEETLHVLRYIEHDLLFYDILQGTRKPILVEYREKVRADYEVQERRLIDQLLLEGKIKSASVEHAGLAWFMIGDARRAVDDTIRGLKQNKQLSKIRNKIANTPFNYIDERVRHAYHYTWSYDALMFAHRDIFERLNDDEILDLLAFGALLDTSSMNTSCFFTLCDAGLWSELKQVKAVAYKRGLIDTDSYRALKFYYNDCRNANDAIEWAQKHDMPTAEGFDAMIEAMEADAAETPGAASNTEADFDLQNAANVNNTETAAADNSSTANAETASVEGDADADNDSDAETPDASASFDEAEYLNQIKNMTEAEQLDEYERRVFEAYLFELSKTEHPIYVKSLIAADVVGINNDTLRIFSIATKTANAIIRSAHNLEAYRNDYLNGEVVYNTQTMLRDYRLDKEVNAAMEAIKKAYPNTDEICDSIFAFHSAIGKVVDGICDVYLSDIEDQLKSYTATAVDAFKAEVGTVNIDFSDFDAKCDAIINAGIAAIDKAIENSNTIIDNETVDDADIHAEKAIDKIVYKAEREIERAISEVNAKIDEAFDQMRDCIVDAKLIAEEAAEYAATSIQMTVWEPRSKRTGSDRDDDDRNDDQGNKNVDADFSELDVDENTESAAKTGGAMFYIQVILWAINCLLKEKGEDDPEDTPPKKTPPKKKAARKNKKNFKSSVVNQIAIEKGGAALNAAPSSKAVAEVQTDDGTKLRAVYIVRPIGAVIASHYINGSSVIVNDKYPAELQPRNREGMILHHQVVKMAKTLEPAMLAASVNLNQGAPVIRADGVVLNGNGRAMALALAYRLNLATAAKYKSYLIEHAADWGLTREAVSMIDKPVLLREVNGVDGALLDEIIHSTLGGSDMSTFETAKTDAAKLTLGDFNEYNEDSKGDFTKSANVSFVSKILWRLTKPNERNRYWRANGNLNADAFARVKRAVFALAYDDDGLIEKMAESVDDDVKNISKALETEAPRLAKLSLLQADGLLHKYELAATLSYAVRRYEYVKNSGFKAVARYFAQISLFDSEPVSVEKIMRFFDENRRNVKWIVEFLQNVEKLIKDQGDPREVILDGMTHEPWSLDAIIDKALSVTNEEKTGGTNLFAAA